MIIIENLEKTFGEKTVFENVSFTINISDKIGIVGTNGVGKSTLIKCILDNDYATKGKVNLQKHTIGYLEQSNFVNEEIHVYNEFLSLFPSLNRLSNKLKMIKKDESIELTNEELKSYISLEEKFSEQGGYEFKTKVIKFLTGFSFKKEDISRKIRSFSGGEKTKLMLIKLLLVNPDFLILDEPTNHLDINAISWLETYLKNYKKGILLISHDQIFLNQVCNKTLELTPQSVILYKTKFDNYIKQSELNYSVALQTYEKQQKKIQKYQDFIDKNSKTPSKIGQVNDRKSKLEQLKKLEKPIKFNKKISFKFEGLNKKKETYIDFYNVSLKQENKELLKKFNFKLYGGEKVFIIGANGVGKTTLFRAILKQMQYDGKINIPSKIKIGYFDQEQKNLNPNKTLLETIEETNEFDSITAARKYLAKFLFTREEIFKQVANLSGGEKVRLSLALIGLEKYDVLLLDEPTNHLDFETKKILENALLDFCGSLLIISHDRYLINKLATALIVIENQKATHFLGNWTEFQEFDKKLKELQKNIEKDEKKVEKEKEQGKIEVIENFIKKPIKKINEQKLKLIEKDIETHEIKKEEIAQQLEEKKTYSDHKELQNVLQKLDIIEKELKTLYTSYEETIEGK